MAKRPIPVQPPKSERPAANPKKKEHVDSTIVENRKARHDYHVDETLETGIVLTGTEVKSLRAGHVNIADGFCTIQKDELFLHNAKIEAYTHGSAFNHPPQRMRKLLAHRHEIDRLESKVQAKGYTIVPLKMYWKGGRAKVLVGLARGKKQYDQRDDIQRREHDREAARAMRRGRR